MTFWKLLEQRDLRSGRSLLAVLGCGLYIVSYPLAFCARRSRLYGMLRVNSLCLDNGGSWLFPRIRFVCLVNFALNTLYFESYSLQ